MINKILAYTILNIKSLCKDKIPFVWSIVLPLIMFYFDKEYVYSEKDLIYWWVYMILCSFIYGIGLYALDMKESGCLRTIFSIDNSSLNFFLGNCLTQLVYCIICIVTFDMVVTIVKDFLFIKVLELSIKTIVFCVPFAFLGYGFTLVKYVHVNTLKTIFSISLLGMFVMLNANEVLNRYNPMYYVANALMNDSVKNRILYCIFSLVCMIIGVFSVWSFSPHSNERR